MDTQVIWHGTQQESFDLVNAINHNCACEHGLMGVLTKVCPTHEAMVQSQRFMDGLIFERWRLARLMPGAGQRVIHPK